MLITAPVPLLKWQYVVDMKTPERLTRGDLNAFFCCSEVCCSILEVMHPSYTVKKVSGFPLPSRDVTYQTLPGWE
jgi:hypothetical protein